MPGAPHRNNVDPQRESDRKSTRLNSSHSQIPYAVVCLKKTTALTRQARCDVSCQQSARHRVAHRRAAEAGATWPHQTVGRGDCVLWTLADGRALIPGMG